MTKSRVSDLAFTAVVQVLCLGVGIFILSSTRAKGQVGTVTSEQKISDLSGGFTGVLADGVRFGSGGAALGDLDGDGVVSENSNDLSPGHLRGPVGQYFSLII